MMRFGLIGTGHWARVTHAPALASAEGAEFASVWGRNLDAALDLAANFGATPYQHLPEFLDSVDAVAFSVPPEVQAPIAIQAAKAGKHLLLEKPIAVTTGEADALVSAVERAGVASVVFFTARFRPDVRAWLADVTAIGGWDGGAAVWLGSALAPSSPFNTPWRQVKGGLWDVAPHLVSLLLASLGPVGSVTAETGKGDVTHLILRHASGVTSTVTTTVNAPQDAEFADCYLWGEAGRPAIEVATADPVAALRTALAELVSNARSGQVRHPCDVWFGRDVVAVLADAQRQI